MYSTDTIVFSIFLIFAGAALLSTLALYTRQSQLVAYIVLGALFGPFGLKFINDATVIRQFSDVGIIFLLFLLGLNLRPQSLWHLFRKTVGISLVSSILLAVLGFALSRSFGFTLVESFIIGITMMFSSTIIGLKLLPTTVLHHRHTGEVMISILLLQDLIAIVVLLSIHIATTGKLSWSQWGLAFISLPLLFLIAYFAQRFILMPLITRFNQVREYIFLLSIGWCLSMAQLSGWMGLSEGIGAFLAGVAIAAHPISEFIADSLRPLRDFFLIMFFFCIGASFNFHYLDRIILPTIILAIVMLLMKPLIFQFFMRQMSEMRTIAVEVGIRLGQVSEFSLLIAYIAERTHLIGVAASSVIQATTIVTFIVSSYVVILFYPTPMAISERLRRD